jgi:type I restriction enzyme S subunit
MAISAGVPHINLTMLRDLRLISPPLPVQERFEALMQPMAMSEQRLILATENLRATRELLLPRLVSGDIDVEQLDIFTEDIAA